MPADGCAICDILEQSWFSLYLDILGMVKAQIKRLGREGKVREDATG